MLPVAALVAIGGVVHDARIRRVRAQVDGVHDAARVEEPRDEQDDADNGDENGGADPTTLAGHLLHVCCGVRFAGRLRIAQRQPRLFAHWTLLYGNG